MTYLFLDTEWADAAGAQLVSLALVSEDGAYALYAERDPLPASPTEFVRDIVYPLLDRGRFALSDQAITTRLRAFMCAINVPVVMVDHPNDMKLLKGALAGFNLPEHEVLTCGPMPGVDLRVLDGALTWMVVEDWFGAHPDQATRRHHALVDAQVLRIAWLATTRQVEAPWSPTLALGRPTA